MDLASLIAYINEEFEGLHVAEAYGYTFFSYDPDGKLPDDRRHPFATIAMPGNEYESMSKLDRPGVYRLNLGVKKETYRSLFGTQPALGPAGVIETGHDFAAIDQLLPHPHYAPQSWICVVSPGDETFEKTVRPLLHEAYDEAVRKNAKLRVDAT